jgi:hypothetical protein
MEPTLFHRIVQSIVTRRLRKRTSFVGSHEGRPKIAAYDHKGCAGRAGRSQRAQSHFAWSVHCCQQSNKRKWGAADGSFQKEFGYAPAAAQGHSSGALLGFVCCDQSAVTVRIGARLAGAEFAPLPWTGSTSRTSDSEYLFCADGFLHGPERMLRRPSAGMVNFEQARRLFVRDL